MSSFFGKIKGIFSFKTKGKKKYFLSAFLVLFLVFFVLGTNNVQATSWVLDSAAGAIGTLMTWICWAMAQLFIKLTIFASTFFITIASYNNFINSQAVILGWILVRDVVNMAFVLILLVIAFSTVLGIEGYEWKKLMVKLLFAAIFVNFSRLICGVIIDASQVFTMTFVNGFAATAGGNVIAALKLGEGLKLSTQAEALGVNDLNYLIAAMAAVMVAVISFFVMGAYMVIMLARVVTLWVLIILSPIAFVSSVLPATQKYASEWWKEFTNHVLAGPILAFFFWLAFAVVGNGNIVSEFDSSKMDGEKIVSEGIFSNITGGEAGSEAKAGITQLLEWQTLASFAIAIALLITGVKKTQELGVTGASALNSAMSTAKKVGMYATGAKFAGWAGMNMPVIGGKSMIRNFNSAKGLAKFGMSYAGLKRDQWAVKLEESTRGKAGLDLLGKAGSGLLESEARANEKSEKLQELADKMKPVRKAYFSTSKTFAGRTDETVKGWSEIAEEYGPIKGKNKAEKRKKQMFDNIKSALQDEENFLRDKDGKLVKKTDENGIETQVLDEGKVQKMIEKKFSPAEVVLYREMIEKQKAEAPSWQLASEEAEELVQKTDKGSKRKEEAAEEKLQHEQMTNILKQEDVVRELKTMKKLLGEISGKESKAELVAKQQLFQSRQAKVRGSKAYGEHEKREQDKKEEIKVAEAKDALLIKNGQKPRYRSQVEAAQQKETEDLNKDLNYREVTARGELYVDDLKELEKDLTAGTVTQDEYEKKLLLLQKNTHSIIKVNANRGGEELEDSFKRILEKLDYTQDEIEDKSVGAMQRKVLAVTRLKKVDKNEDINKVFEGIKQTFGEDYTNTLIREYDAAFIRASKDGSLNFIGLFDDRDVQPNGQVKYAMEDETKLSDGKKSFSRGNKDYFCGAVNTSKIIDIGSLIEGKNEVNDNSKENFKQVFVNITKGTKLDSRFVKSFQNLPEKIQNELLGALESVNAEAANNFRIKVGKEAKKIGVDKNEVKKEVEKEIKKEMEEDDEDDVEK